MQYLSYLLKLLTHKYYVFLACAEKGLYWRGFVHDMSKFLPSEFIPYANHFYESDGSAKKIRDKTGYYKPTNTGDKAFDYAWLSHQHRNLHHWQYWCLQKDNGGIEVLEMKEPYRTEMICDWIGASRAYENNDVPGWWAANKHKMSFGPETLKWVEQEVTKL